MSAGGTARRFGLEGILSMTDSAIAVLLAAVLGASVAVPAYGQTQTTETPVPGTETSAQTTTPTETTPTETTPTPPSPEPTSAPNEYVESVPTGGGQSPAPRVQEPAAPTPVAPAPTTTTPAIPPDSTGRSTQATPTPRKPHRKKHRRTHERRHADDAPVRTPAQPAMPSTPAAAEAGDPGSPLLLGFALLLITASVLGTAVANRQRAGV